MQLSKHETNTKATVIGPAVTIPDHLRVTNADCAHLSFGSFGSGAFSGSFPSKLLARNLEAAPALDDVSIINESDTRNHKYYNNEPHKSSLIENVTSIYGTASEKLDDFNFRICSEESSTEWYRRTSQPMLQLTPIYKKILKCQIFHLCQI